MFKKIFAALVLIILAGVGGVLYFEFHRDTPLNITSDFFYTVEQGATLTSVANELEEQGIIKSARILLLSARLNGNKPVIAGNYKFIVGSRLKDLENALVSGDAITDEVQVTFPEGYVIDDMAVELVDAGLIADEAEFVTAANTNIDRFVKQFTFLESIPEGQGLEGYLFPDTYRFFADAKVDEIILAMLRNFDSKLDNAARQEIARSGKTIHDVIILASLVEKEVRGVDEMQVVAGLFQNRLDIGMLIQADSTIGYVTKSGRDRSTFADLEIDSPYNTYKYAGLPPGPISNPGLNAITAAISPAETDYLFFLTNRTSGQVYYGRTLEEHNRNRQLYLE